MKLYKIKYQNNINPSRWAPRSSCLVYANSQKDAIILLENHGQSNKKVIKIEKVNNCAICFGGKVFS